MITGLLQLYSFPAFNAAIDLVEVPDNPSQFLSQLTEVFARAFIANQNGFSAAVALLHAVTAPSAVRLLVPHLKPDVTKMLIRYCWQATAGLHTAFGAVGNLTQTVASPPNAASLIDRAVDIGVKTSDPHVIKFAEACVREYDLNASPAYLIAAEMAMETLAEHPA